MNPRKTIKNILAITLLPVALAFAAVGYAGDDLQMGVDAFNKKDYSQALKILKPLAEAGNAEAQFRLGAMYGQGMGVEQDRAKSLELIKKSADQGNLDALERLVAAYGFMPGASDAEVDAVIKKALSVYQEESGKGNTRAMVKMGGMYEMGFGVEQSQDEALNWYKKAAELGDADGQFKLGKLYYSGIGGTEKDAKPWFEKAVAQGNKEAQEYLDSYPEEKKAEAKKVEEVAAKETMPMTGGTVEAGLSAEEYLKNGWDAKLKSNNDDLAYKNFVKCMEVDSSNTGCGFGKGIMAFNLGRYEEARGVLVEVRKNDKNNPFVPIFMARSLSKMKKYDAAIKEFDIAEKELSNTEFPDKGDLFFYRAEAKQAMGDTEGACADWRLSTNREGKEQDQMIEKHCK